jgi:hypothetical protein
MNEKTSTASAFIDNLIDEQGGKIIFRICLVQITKVHAHTNHTMFLVNQNQV